MQLASPLALCVSGVLLAGTQFWILIPFYRRLVRIVDPTRRFDLTLAGNTHEDLKKWIDLAYTPFVLKAMIYSVTVSVLAIANHSYWLVVFLTYMWLSMPVLWYLPICIATRACRGGHEVGSRTLVIAAFAALLVPPFIASALLWIVMALRLNDIAIVAFIGGVPVIVLFLGRQFAEYSRTQLLRVYAWNEESDG